MKRKLTLLFMAFAICTSFLVPAWATAAPQLEVDSQAVSVIRGESFSVRINLENNPGFESLQVDVLFDTDVLTCTNVTSGELLVQDGTMYAGNKNNDGKATFAAINVDPIEGNGTLVELTFLAKRAGSVDISAKAVRMVSFGERISLNNDIQSIDVVEAPLPSEPDVDETPEVPEIPESPDVSQTPDVPAVSFSDVPKNHWAYTYVQNAVANGLFSGIGNGMFGPAMNVTRGMFVTTLYSAAGSPDVELSDFTDVPATAWYAKAVAWASQQGIVSGIGDNKFGPDLPITREQIALILFNYADGVSPGTEMFVLMSYPDAKDIHSWALTAFTWAMKNELISGKSGNVLDPLATATRAEVAVIMQNFVNLSK